MIKTDESKKNMKKEEILYIWENLLLVEHLDLINGNYDGKASNDLYYFLKRTLVDMLRKDIDVYNYLPEELKDCDIIQDAYWDIMTNKSYITAENSDKYYADKYKEQVQKCWEQYAKKLIKEEDEVKAFETFIPECVETGIIDSSEEEFLPNLPENIKNDYSITCEAINSDQRLR